MDTIRLTSSQLIADITEKLLELQKTRELENDIKTEELAEESRFFSNTEECYAIYEYHQVDNELGYQYMSLDFIEKMGMSVKGSDYQMMYQGVLEVQDTLGALIKMLDEPECIENRWLDDEAKGEKWLLEFQELALTEEYREWIRNYIDKKYEERGLPYPTGADFD